MTRVSTAPAASPAALQVQGLHCAYGESTILENVNFSVERGELFFIIGGSGCGKSTLLRHLVGLKQPKAGSIQYFGADFLNQDEAARRTLLASFGVLFQSGALWSSLTLAENVMLPMELHRNFSPKERRALAAERLSQVGLSGFEDHYPAEISGGMRKRAGLARALALNPAIVFFDEPSAGLDPITARKLDDLILHLRDTLGTTCVVVSHELASILGIGDRVILLSKDTRGIVATGKPRELASHSTEASVREFFDSGNLPLNSPT